MKQAPNVWQLERLFEVANECAAEIDGKWVPARPLGFFGLRSRIKAAWKVFTGRADAVVWPGNQ